MPYADPEKRRAQQRQWVAAKYAGSPEFQEAEAARKAKWLAEGGREKNAEASRRARAKIKPTATSTAP